MGFLIGYVCLFYVEILGIIVIIKGKIDGFVVVGSSCGVFVMYMIEIDVFIIFYIICIFIGCVGSREVFIWFGFISEINDFYSIFWRFDFVVDVYVVIYFF